MDELPRFEAQPGYEFYARRTDTEPPGLGCLIANHMWITNAEPGAFTTSDGQTPWANWCLWCGGGSSNEDIPA